MFEFLWSCMIISFKGMFGTLLWALGIGGFFFGIGLMVYPFMKKKEEIKIKERPDPPPPKPEADRKPTSTVSLGDLKKEDKTIH